MMAASDRFALVVRGVGGHGALPHTTRDPVVAASAVVLALQALVSRETSPVDSAVVTVARFNTGPGAPNVIPDEVELIGTVRALTASTFQRLHVRLEQVAAGVAAAYGCSVDKVTWSAVMSLGRSPNTSGAPVVNAPMYASCSPL
ncbi:IAA-amino acid hydrolase ILR1-like 1, partial [Tetrabaena socialis]